MAGEHKFCDTQLKNLPLTMAYVPFQKIENIFTEEEALKSGTLFTNLDKPFLGKRI
ncbi:MAG: spore coat associated protein CotJA [Clostridia bacterium]|nr:spore coat associated protein CotJA [Clostridia bacterium]MBQ7107644.1 spore coat associated protein CotJA [Clostridia bacterium]